MSKQPRPYRRLLHEGRLVTTNWYNRNVLKKLTRPCVLENLYSGRVISADSIVAFCREAGLGGNARYHISAVLDDKRHQFHNWYKPEILGTELDLKDVYGNVYPKVSLRDWLKRRNHKNRLGTTAIMALVRGTKKFIGGGKLTLASTPIDAIIAPKAYRIKDFAISNGEHTIKGTSIYNVAQQAGLNPPDVYSLAYGFRDEVKGYKVKRLIAEDKVVLTNV